MYKCLEYLENHIQRVSFSDTACIIKKKVMTKKTKTLCLCLIQKWCKWYSVGRCENNLGQFRCYRPFSVKIGLLVDMILLATKSCESNSDANGNGQEEVSWSQKYIFTHMTIGKWNGMQDRLCFQCLALSLCNDCDTLVLLY